MPEKTAITKAIVRYSELHDRFNLTRNNDPMFFSEWHDEDGMALTYAQKDQLDFLKQRFVHYLEEDAISEGTVNIIMLAPLINMAGFCDRPYRIKGEQWVKIKLVLEEDSSILEGRIDALVVRLINEEKLWLTLIEGKRGGFSVLQAIPQALTYMMVNPRPNTILFGLVTNGEDYLFLKLNTTDKQYALSQKFTLVNPNSNELYSVLKIMQRLVKIKSQQYDRYDAA